MAIRMVMLLSVVTLCMWSISCERLGPDEAVLKAVRQLKIEPLKALDAIPLEFGNLVGVSSDSSKPNWAQLWFEKQDKTIVVVWVNFLEGGLHATYVLVPRR